MRRVKFRAIVVFAAIVMLTIATGGCASWKDSPDLSGTGLPTIRDNAQSVILEVEFVPIVIESDELEIDASLWQWVDETAIDADARRKLIANGLKVGKVVSLERLRARLETLSTKQDVVDDFLKEASIASNVSHTDKRIPMRMGRRHELPLKDPIEGQHVTLLRVDGQTIGRTLPDPQYLFAVTASPGNVSGQALVKLRPEIQHGEMRQRWVSSDSALRIDTRRETWSIESLDIELKGNEGDTFVIAGVQPLGGLARQMLSGHSADASQQQVVVLITFDQIPDAIDQL